MNCRLPRALRTLAAAGATYCLALACSSLPPAPTDVSTDQTPLLVGAKGQLSAERSKAILAALDSRRSGTDLLEEHLAMEEAITDLPLTIGNRVTLLQDGPVTYRAMSAAIRAAKDHINLETYILEDDEIGRQLSDMLIDKQKAGVQINIVYDSVGSISTPTAFFQRLADHGINVVQFNPINPLEAQKDWYVNHRDHRKLLITDGRVAFTGGINYSGVYSGGSFRRPNRQPASGDVPWRDTHVQIEGPVVADFQKLFLETWTKQHGPPLPDRHYFPYLREKGSHIVRVIGSTPDRPTSPLYGTLMSAISNAERSVHLTNAYFVPDPRLVRALQDAARRKVDVKLILPSHTDFWAPLYAGRSHYSDLLRAGVQIYERRTVLLHAKTGVVDGVWSMVGSSNLDWRSFLHNDELDAVVLGSEFGAEMEAAFAKDLAESSRIELAAWNQRSIGSRFRELGARMWEYWL